MKRFAALCMITIFTINSFGQVSVGVDVYNRYVWRGTDFSNTASIQPSLEYSIAGFTFGAWGAWAINGAAGGNENDLFVSTQLGPVAVTFTDYFFPEYTGTDAILDLESHIFEASAGIELGPVSTLIALNVSGDDDNSAYLEFNYKVLTIGLGNGVYSTDGNFAPVNIGISGEKDNLSVAYIINPNQETSFLVVGMSF
ncbi:MAG: hypothetical protein HQ507_12430 [Candidatus Marinimicrobia bacterium]|nr:hypothetical protein [Candidatus Neomarinimicrobiota bacterium]